MKVLVVVDMQNDFIDGALANPAAQAIVDDIAEVVKEPMFDAVVFTQDTHQENYLETQEGKNLPIKHCIDGEPGHAINGKISSAALMKGFHTVTKESFGDIKNLKSLLDGFVARSKDKIESIHLCGTCTDICVVSNALILRSMYPELDITVDASCCAGVTPESHKAALLTMKMCQINVIGE